MECECVAPTMALTFGGELLSFGLSCHKIAAVVWPLPQRSSSADDALTRRTNRLHRWRVRGLVCLVPGLI